MRAMGVCVRENLTMMGLRMSITPKYDVIVGFEKFCDAVKQLKPWASVPFGCGFETKGKQDIDKYNSDMQPSLHITRATVE